MLPSPEQLFKDADFIFQQDLAPVHTAKSTRSWLNDHGVGVLDWPANSPDLNPRESMEYRQEENENLCDIRGSTIISRSYGNTFCEQRKQK